LLSHADRSRFGIGKDKGPLFSVEREIHGTVLVDGAVGATWRLDHAPETATATLFVDHLGTMTKRVASSVTAEGRRMLRFQLPDAATRNVRFNQLD
jgi:Winged helix DNA-binding domain